MPELLKTLLTCLGSVGLFEFIQFLINRHDNKKGMLGQIWKVIKDLQKRLVKNERDNCRTQMLLLMSDFPEERQELFLLARRYFVELKGDWYATTLFQSHLAQNGIPVPPWFKGSHEGQEIEIKEK